MQKTRKYELYLAAAAAPCATVAFSSFRGATVFPVESACSLIFIFS